MADLELTVGRRRVRVTHPDRVLFPGDGVTKGDLAEYYAAIGDAIVPHLRDRPFTLKRLPYGIRGRAVLPQAGAEGQAAVDPDAHRSARGRARASRGSSTSRSSTTPAAVLWMVQMNCIDMNAWYSRVDKPDRPGLRALRPRPAGADGFALAIRVAHLIREELERLELESYVKTSGADGIHVLADRAPSDVRADLRVRGAAWRAAARGAASRAGDDRVAEAASARACSSTTARTRAGRRSPRSTRCGRSRARRSRRRFAGTS